VLSVPANIIEIPSFASRYDIGLHAVDTCSLHLESNAFCLPASSDFIQRTEITHKIHELYERMNAEALP
jgi:hypothetical protein